MVRKKMLGCILGILLIPFILGSAPVSAEETNSSMEEIQSAVTIYDNEGNLVEPLVEPNDNLISLLAATAPTKVKYLNNSATYQSNGFSGSGRRYSGYTFTTKNASGKFKLTFKKGGFGVNTHTWASSPLDVSESYNLPLSGSPYTLITKKYFYFLVDNPKKGQTYKVSAIK
ncbi:hypothetical protein [Virgibacillus proomii]|uniref:hypothetical protein n=1 Tax=Virgibacillus proomii TaxID=84407 RepID=UPI001C125368|nr:hypothetical protein [Virgibacillus proomii]MBU5265499.1 hypothetical protein [Virgibacillus proomii]